jgi:hypothetical protein
MDGKGWRMIELIRALALWVLRGCPKLEEDES